MRKRFTLAITAVLTLSALFSPVAMAQETTTGSKIIDIADDYIGVPYKYGGTTPSAFDCSGYTGYVYRQAGIDLPRTAAQQYNVGQAVNKADLQQGDLVFFTTTSTKISHVGIYIGDNKFLSATTSKGVKVDSLNDPYYWGKRYVGAKRVIQEEQQAAVLAEVVEVVQLPEGEYHDVAQSNWAFDAIKSLSNDGIIAGYGGQYFKPGNAITRAEAAKMLTSTLAVTASANTTVSYQDVSENHWAFDFIVAASEHELLNGYENQAFKPDEPISRAEVAAMLSRAFDIQQNGPDYDFNDLDENHWAYNEVQALATNGIINGYGNQTFRGTEATTRAEFSYMLYNALNH